MNINKDDKIMNINSDSVITDGMVMLHISKGNMKLGRIPNISLIPVDDCGYNSYHCMRKCYARKAYRLYPQSRIAWGNNSWAFRNCSRQAFKLMQIWFEMVNPEFFRISTSGDLLNQSYLNSWMKIGKKNNNTKFLVMTKMFDLNYSDIPENMHVRFSLWSTMEQPKLKKGVSGYVWIDDGLETRIPEDAFRCTGKCIECLYCWNKTGDVVIKLH